MPEKKLFLLDSHALAYRAYYAMIRNPLSTSNGQPTGALYGFATYLIRLVKDHRCPYIAAVFDSGKPSFRAAIYDQYKAHRPPMPDDLASQMPLIRRCVDLFNIPLIVREGLEADDVLAALAKKAAAQGFTVYLVTKDKDLMQLVGERIRMLAPADGGTLDEYGPEKVREKMGVEPERIRDLLSLMGDASDNIPGVEGVGPKTALKILEKAGTVEHLLADPHCVGNDKLADKIEKNRDVILLSRKLATLKDDEELGIDIESLAARPVKHAECIEFFREMEFNSLLKSPLFERQRTEAEFTITTAAAIGDVAGAVRRIRAAGFVSIDTETTATEPHNAELVGISMAVDTNEAWYVPVGHDDKKTNLPLEKVLEELRPVLESEKILKIGQNLKYDYQIFKKYGCVLRGITFDAMVAAYLIDPGKRQFNMDALAQQYLSINTTPIESLIGKGKEQKSFAVVPVAQAARYSGEDAVVPIKLKEVFEPILKERNLDELFEKIEMPLVTVLAELEWTGVAIDCEVLEKLSAEYSKKLAAISKEIFLLAGEEFNLNSPKQVSDVLFNKMRLPKSKKTKTGLSTDVDALEKLAPEYPIAQKLLQYREVQKLLSTYIDALPQRVNIATGRVHTSFNQTVTATGRLSSTDPNLQNIPVRTEDGRRIREAFVAPKGMRLVSADYSQIELRVLAHMSRDPLLIKAFEEDKDIHTATAAAIYGVFPEMVTQEMRRAAKTINFGLMYGMGPINLSRQLGITFHESKEFIEAYFRQFPMIRRHMDECIEKARKLGYSETLLGRRRYLPDINTSSVQIREAAERIAINTPVQGTAADIIKIAMRDIHAEMGERFDGARMILQVHDELVFEVPAAAVEEFSAWVKQKMSGAYSLIVPLKVDVGSGRNWSEAH